LHLGAEGKFFENGAGSLGYYVELNNHMRDGKGKLVATGKEAKSSVYLDYIVGATYTVRVTLDIYANESAAQAGTNPLFRSYYFNVPAATTDANKWYPINVTANIEGGYSELVFVVRMYGDSLNGGIGNDIALDNVLVTQPTAINREEIIKPREQKAQQRRHLDTDRRRNGKRHNAR